MLLLILFAFLGGFVTILSPCILPILPIVLSGSVTGGKQKPFGIVTGFVISFTFFTLFLTSIVRLTGVSATALRNLSVIILALFGLTLLVPQLQVLFEKLFSKLAASSQSKKPREGFGGGILIGLSLGLIWTPCVGPILASVISLALTGNVNGSALLITLAYALGTAIPMFAIMYGGRKLLNKVPWLLANTGKIQKAFGVLMILTALMIFFNFDRNFQTYILNKFPNYGVGLTSFEDQEAIKKQLNNLDQDKKMLTDNMSAPELILGGQWLNSEALNLADLKGQVVMLDFMTYSCINCIRTFPYLNAWYEKYQDDGLVIIGIHTPEFEFEKNPDNVAKALKDFEIKFPVMQDNDYATWRAYGNQYWPRKYIVNHLGNLVYDHIGEGGYEETEKVIQNLLAARNKDLGQEFSDLDLSHPDNVEQAETKSPEIYFGASRNSLLGNGKKLQLGQQVFVRPEKFQANTLYLAGTWQIEKEFASSLAQNNQIIFPYYAKKVFMVAGSAGLVSVQIFQDGQYLKTIEIQDQKLYPLVENESSDQHLLELKIENANLDVFTFTFG